jgi:hypothetical protein
LKLDSGIQDLCFALKIPRIKRAIDSMDIGQLRNIIKECYISNLLKNNKDKFKEMTDQEIKLNDYVKQSEFLYLYYFMKSAKLFFVIICVSYFFGMAIRILIEAELDFVGHIVLTECYQSGGWFAGCYDSWKNEIYVDIITLKYFSLTTLSTVGFGDFEPRSNAERLFIAFGMLGGIAIFSTILGNFIEMLDVIKDFSNDYEDFCKLNQFFGMIKKFNRGTEVELTLRKRIENYFEYRWLNYKNQALGPEDEQIHGQLNE